MRIIRAVEDDPMGSLDMFVLFIDWNIRRCNVAGCTRVPSTIVGGLEGAKHAIGICEEHFQKANQPTGPVIYQFVWDNFDAFEYAERERIAGKTEQLSRNDRDMWLSMQGGEDDH